MLLYFATVLRLRMEEFVTHVSCSDFTDNSKNRYFLKFQSVSAIQDLCRNAEGQSPVWSKQSTAKGCWCNDHGHGTAMFRYFISLYWSQVEKSHLWWMLLRWDYAILTSVVIVVCQHGFSNFYYAIKAA